MTAIIRLSGPSVELLRDLAVAVRRSATARIGSAQRRRHAEEAMGLAAELGSTSFAGKATSAALLAMMVAVAWNANKSANAKRLRWANKLMSAAIESKGNLTTWQAAIDAIDSAPEAEKRDLDATCGRTYDEASLLRAQALEASQSLRELAVLIELGS